ncbi:beta strand repeat-containing protein [Pseudomonas frederiksbergensis]|uniref:beta strand repeat-containing protein n=1 Tax=Pseudomonas frederiksbergensis TaxID=104087 RepID=UPI003D2437BD
MTIEQNSLLTNAMSVVASGANVSLDETSGLQNATATPTPTGDADDNDILVTSLPSTFATRLTALGAGTATGAALSGYTGAVGNTGSNAFTVTADPGATITNISFVDSNGVPLNGVDSGLDTLNGTSILLYTDANNDNIVLGRAGGSTGAIVFAAYIEETGSPVSGGKIWTVEYQPLKHPDATNADDSLNLLNKVFIGASQDLEFNLANAPSGQNLFLMFTKANPATATVDGVVRITDPVIIATGKDPANQSTGASITTGDTINTSQAGGPTTFGTNSQMITEQEGIRYSFVTGARQDMTIPNLDQNEADVESNIDFTGVFNAKMANFDVVQLQSGKSAVVKISAFSTAVESGAAFIDGYAGDTPVAITNVRVFNSAGVVIENSNGSVNDSTILITFSGGVATITGVKAGYQIEYTTTSDHNRVLIENGAALDAKGTAHADFDIGGFTLVQASISKTEIGSKMIFEDDGPTATGTAATGTVDEDGLANGIAGGTGDVAGEATTASGSVTGIFQSGADTPLSYALSSNTSGLPALSSGGVALVYSVAGGTLTAKAGVAGADVFTFSLTAAGAYTFTLLKPLDHAAGNNENDITLNLGSLLQATDKDGDTVTAAAEKLVITVDDDTPTATGTAVTGTVDEDGLANGIAGGVGDAAGEATTASGSVTGIFQSGADTPLSYALSSDTSGLPALSSGGVALVYSVVGNTLTATAGATDVFTFSLTAAGAYTFTLLKPLDHAAGNNENDITINLGSLLQATDKDGDTVTTAADKLVITVDDDTPTATGTAATGTVDEDGLANGIAGGTGDVAGEATTASGSVTGIFQPGADTPLSYALSSNTSGLPALSSGGVALVYSVVGGTLTATAGATDVFTFSLTAAGAYTFTLLKPLDHAAGNNENDITLNLGSLLQATDKDGDTVTAAAEKLVITVDDDTPTATGTAATGTVDEDGLANGIAGGTGDAAGEATTASGSVTGIFQSGADTPLSYALSSDTSGLPVLNSGGVALVYSVAGGTLTAKAGVAGADVFTFSLTTAGAYTFTLLKPLDHAAGNNENDITLNLGSLLQATDKDGDTVTAAADKLVITVDDDTPTATGTAATGTVDEDGLANGIAGGTGDAAGEATTASGSVTGIFQSGADTPLSYALSSNTSGLPALSSGGVALVYSVAGGTLTAKAGVAGADVFTFSLTAAGAYTFTLLKPLDHAAGNNENDITLNLGSLLQATDKDGDTVTAAAEKLVITVDDDTPTATGTAVTGTVDEDGLANGIAGGVGDAAGEATTASGSVTGIFQSGADTPLSYALSSDTSGLPALSSGGVALVYSVVGNTLTATAGATDVFTFSLTAAGAYTFTLLKPLDHAAGNNENDITINLGSLLQATDKDGDTVTTAADKLVITVDDDTPTATGTAATGTVDEDGLANGIAGGTGDVTGEATTASGSVTGIFQSGADTPLSYTLLSDTSGLPALNSGGVALVYSVAGGTLTAKAGAIDVFTFSLTAAGAYTFTLLKPLDHAAGNNENDITLNLGSLLQATDKDGDTVTAAAEKLVITVDDDTPTATGTAATGTVDEDGLANGIAGGTGDAAGEATTASGSVTGIFQSGADTPLSYALSSDTSGLPALSSAGVALVYSVAGGTLTAKAGVAGADVFTFSLTTAGAYTFTLLKPLDHAAGNNENDITLNLGSLLQATDKDGDTVTAAAEKLVITVDDDTPTATGTAATGTVDEDGLANGIAGGTGDVTGEATTASGSVTGIFQSGADTPLTYALSSDTSGLPALSSGGVALVYSVLGGTLTAKAGVAGADVFTFSLTAAGAYTFTLLKPLDHAAGNNENDITLNLGSLLQATDKDGDTVTAAAEKLVITVDDDTPTATGTAATGTVDEDGLANGIAGGTGDAAGEATTASGSVTGIFQSGADTPLSYALSSDTSGLPALSSGGVALVYSVVGGTLTAKAGVAGADVFTFSLTAAGAYTFTLLKPLDHAAGNNENDITLNLGSLLQATDKDGDTVTTAADKLVITVDDDTPVIGTAPVQDVDPTLGATSWTFSGDFAYSIGADQRGPTYSSAADSDFAELALSGSANDVAIVDPTVTWDSENLSAATFNVSFEYDHDRNAATATELVEGTLVFDKVNDTYTFEMDALQTTQDVTLGEGTGYETYDVDGTSPSSGPSPVATGKLGEGFYIQITGFEAPLSAGGNTVVAAGELVSGTQAPVTLSSTALGVSGNTIQAGEAANINFFQTDPKGDLGADDFSYATDFFIKFDGYETESDDLLLIVSLADADDSSITTTRAIYVDQGDVYENDTNNADLVGTKYEALILDDLTDPNDPFLDNNDALLIVESNDFNIQTGDNWLIKGIQILSNDAGLTGSAINLNRNVGADGASSTSAQPVSGLVGPGNTIAEDTSTNPLKIIDAGFSTTTTTPATLDLTLDFKVVDSDSDFTAVQTIDIENPVVIELVGLTNLAPTDLVL